MARVFLDTNIFIDIAEKRGQISLDNLIDHKLFISSLSVHILAYITKRKIPDPELSELVDLFTIEDFDQSICYKSLESPTTDLEDNIQLHSAAEAECDIFLTNDKQLLALKFFGKTRVTQNLEGIS